jgi:glycosyltransferase involved in cell wall biosynthesis
MNAGGVSLVIPVRDEAGSIAALVRSIASQTRPPDETILVDAGSTDGTVDIIRKSAGVGLELKVVSIGVAYPGIARNAGVKQAENELIAFTDAGIKLDKDWLKELVIAMDREGPVDVVYGNYAPMTDTFFKKCLAIAVVPPAKDAEGGKVRPRFLASSLIRKNVWNAVGGFPDLRAAEDRIFMEKVERSGFRTRRSPKATVVWDIPGGLKGVFNRFSSYSYHDLRAHRISDWHMPVLRMYAMALAMLVLGIFLSPALYLLILAGFGLRVARKVAINRAEPYFVPSRIPAYFVVSGFLIFFIDIAMFAGWVRYILEASLLAGRLRTGKV